MDNKSTNLMSGFAVFPYFDQNYQFLSDMGGPISSIILIVELSYYMQNSWAVDALSIGAIPRVPCTAVFLRSRVENILHFLHFFGTIFESALISKILIQELSVFNKCCLKLNFQASKIICRVPCTAVFLRSRPLCQTHFFSYLD